MGTVNITWFGGQKFVATDSTRHSVVLSTTDEGVGMKPSDLLLVALAACTAVDVVEILNKKRAGLTGLEISASGEQDADPPWTFRKIHLKYCLRGHELNEKAVRQAIELSEEKYCSVAATLRATAEISYDFEFINEN